MADIWISSQNGQIGLFDTGTGALVSGTMHYTDVSLTDIAFIGDQMYGTTYDTLYSINDLTGTSTDLGNYPDTTGKDAIVALVGDGNHLLGAAYTNNDVYSIDPSNPSKETKYTSTHHRSAGDLAWAGSTLYEIRHGPRGADEVDMLYDVTHHQLIGTFKTSSPGTFNDVNGLGYQGGTMYAVAGSNIYSVNLTNAHLTSLSSDPPRAWELPVGRPSSTRTCTANNFK